MRNEMGSRIDDPSRPGPRRVRRRADRALTKEGRWQQRLNWYVAQDNDPLWGNPQEG
jgi:hypothetical protein